MGGGFPIVAVIIMIPAVIDAAAPTGVPLGPSATILLAAATTTSRADTIGIATVAVAGAVVSPLIPSLAYARMAAPTISIGLKHPRHPNPDPLGLPAH